MDSGIEAVTLAALGLALDAAALRQQAIAANIANADADGYTPVRVSFEEQLDQARRDLGARGAIDPFALSGVRAELVAATDAGGGAQPVRLDVETAKLAENTVRYDALVKGLNRHMAILGLAVNEGRR